jgi:hypothetical protein
MERIKDSQLALLTPAALAEPRVHAQQSATWAAVGDGTEGGAGGLLLTVPLKDGTWVVAGTGGGGPFAYVGPARTARSEGFIDSEGNL